METGSKDSAYEKSEWKWKAKDWVNVEVLMEPKDLKIALAEAKEPDDKTLNILETDLETLSNRSWLGNWAIYPKQRIGFDLEEECTSSDTEGKGHGGCRVSL